MAGTTLVTDAVERLPDEFWTETFERTPGGRVIRYAAIPGMRLREVEIHHVDLDAGFSPQRLVGRLLLAPDRRDGEARPVGHVVPGARDRPGQHLGDRRRPRRVRHDRLRTAPATSAWWLTGRPPAASLTSSTGDLPPVKAW